MGAGLAVDRLLDRPARALARRKARHRERRPLQLQGVHRSRRSGRPSRRCSTNIDSVSVRDSLTAVVWFKKHTPEQFYDVAYQLIIMPEHVYGAIPLEQLHTSELTRNADRLGRSAS